MHFDSMSIVFDATWNQPFRPCPYWLRFELGGEEFGNSEAPIPRFVQALSRARTIRDAVFADTNQLWAIVVSATGPSNDFFAPFPDGFEALSNLGFRSEHVAEWRARLDPNEPEQNEEDFVWRAFDVTSDFASQDSLLWSSLTYEMPITPKTPVISYLADMERGILLDVYDDRGMVVGALNAAPLQPFYKQFNAWLLDYDRDAMDATFAGT